MRKKVPVPCLDVIMIAFFPRNTVKDHIFNTKLEKGDHYYNTAQGSSLPLQCYSKKTLRKALKNTNKKNTNAQKYKRNVLMPPGHPIILLKSNLIQYGRRIGKKVYY